MPRDACRVWLRMCVWPIHQCGGRAEAAAQLKLQVIWSFNRCCILFESEETGFAIARISCPWFVVHVHSGLGDDAYKVQSAPLSAAYDMKFYSNFILAPVARLFPWKLSAVAFFLFLLRILFYFPEIYLLPPNKHSDPFCFETFMRNF